MTVFIISILISKIMVIFVGLLLPNWLSNAFGFVSFFILSTIILFVKINKD